MVRFGPTGKVSKKQVHLLRWSSFPGQTGLNFGWMDRALEVGKTVIQMGWAVADLLLKLDPRKEGARFEARE